MSSSGQPPQHPYEGRFISVIKPSGISSFKVVEFIRRATGVRKVGHSGTLDPFADGLLVVGIGRSATKHLGELLHSDKEYFGRAVLGQITDTYDCTGSVLETRSVPNLTVADRERVFEDFRGEIEQVPPIFSAVKVKGMRMYKAARKGIALEAKPRHVSIRELELLELTPDGFRFRVLSSHGVYIRSLAHDIGLRLGCGAHLSELTRTRVGDYRIEDALPLDEFLTTAAAEVAKWKGL